MERAQDQIWRDPRVYSYNTRVQLYKLYDMWIMRIFYYKNTLIVF